jgi:hypothetical protein
MKWPSKYLKPIEMIISAIPCGLGLKNYKHMKRIAIVLTLILSGSAAFAQTTNYTAYSLFVVSFAKYASWPAGGNEFKIAVLGKSKVYDEMVKLTANKNINGQTYKIIQIEEMSEVGDAHIVYLPDNKTSQLDDLMKATEGKPVMVVSEREGLYKKGAAFSFLILDNKLRFDVNNSELEKRHIKVSGNLLTLANTTM